MRCLGPMDATPPRSPGPLAERQPAPRTQVPDASLFALALARARAGLARPPPAFGTSPCAAAPAVVLMARRTGADGLASGLRARRAAHDEGATTLAPPRLQESSAPGARELAPPPFQGLLAPAALDRVAAESRRLGGGNPTVELRFGSDVQIRLVHAKGGIEIVLRAGRGAERPARSELTGLVNALRGRGVHVSAASLELAPAGAMAARSFAPGAR